MFWDLKICDLLMQVLQFFVKWPPDGNRGSLFFSDINVDRLKSATSNDLSWSWLMKDWLFTLLVIPSSQLKFPLPSIGMVLFPTVMVLGELSTNIQQLKFIVIQTSGTFMLCDIQLFVTVSLRIVASHILCLSSNLRGEALNIKATLNTWHVLSGIALVLLQGSNRPVATNFVSDFIQNRLFSWTTGTKIDLNIENCSLNVKGILK